MRIVQLIDELSFGGAEKLVADLSTSLARRGHRVTVVCLRSLGTNPVDTSSLLAAGADIVTLNKPPGVHIPTLWRLAQMLRERHVDVLHTHNHLVHHYGAVAGRMAGVTAVLSTLHGSASLRASAAWARALFWVSGAIGGRVVSVCQQIDDVLRKSMRFPARKLAVIDNGVDLDEFLKLIRQPPGEGLVFGAVGRLEPVKDHHTLLRAFAMLRKHHSHVRLRILGDGSLLQSLQQTTRDLNIQQDVCFEGFSLDIASFLSRIDVFVISSRSEGLPLSLLEAMGAGLPVVATSVGEIPSIVSAARCGWLASPKDVSDLAEAMERAVQTKDTVSIGARGRALVRERYSVERMTAEYESLYSTLLRNGGGGIMNREPGSE